MSLFSGRRASVGIGKESSRGVGVAPTYWYPKTSINFSDKVSKVFTEGSYGSIISNFVTGYVASKWAEGNLEGEVSANSFGLLLLALFGTDTPSTLEALLAFQHDFTLQDDNQTDSLTITQVDPNGTFRYRLAMLNSLRIDIKLGVLVSYIANFISKTSQTATVTTPAHVLDHVFSHPHLTFKVAANAGSISGATHIHVKSISLDITKEIEKINVCGTLEPTDIVNKVIKITGTVELNLEDNTWRDYMLNGSVKAMQIKLVSNKKIGSTYYPTLDIVLPKVNFTTWEPATGNNDIASQTINFEAFYDIANARLWSTMQLINGVATY